MLESSLYVEDVARSARFYDAIFFALQHGRFAFGTSDFAPVGDPSEKGRKGTVHFALGDNQNCYPGGQNRSVLHLDGVCHNVSLQILDTGEYIVKDGVWQL